MGSSQSSAQSVVAQPAKHFHVPHERNIYFAGREGVIQSLKQRLCGAGTKANSRMVVLYGHAGNGKTQCALEFCWRLRSESNNFNIFWVSGDMDRFPNDYSSIANSIVPETPKHTTVEFLETVKTLLESIQAVPPWILVVDGVDMADFPYFALLPRSGGNILFTSTSNNLPVQSGVPFDSICIGKMNPSEAAQLLSESTSSVHEPEKIARQKLLHELDYGPAYIARAAAFLRHMKLPDSSVSWYLSEYLALKEARNEAIPAPQSEPEDQAKAPDDIPETTILITANYLTETEPAAFILLQVMSCLDPHCIQFSLFYLKDRIDLHPHVKEIFDEQLLRLSLSEADLVEAFDCLEKFCLITRSPDGKYFQLQQAIREHTLKHLRSDKTGKMFTNAVLLVSLSCPEPSLEKADLFASVLPQIQALTSLRHEHCPEVSKCLLLEIRLLAIRFLRLQGRAPEAVAMAQVAVGRELVRLGTSPATDLLTLEWWHNFSMSLHDIDKFEEARLAGDFVYQNRLRLFGENNSDTLRSLAHLGWIELSSGGDIPKAIQSFEKVISQIENNKDLKQLEVDSRRGLAIAHGKLGNIDDALANQVHYLELQKSDYGEDSTQYLLVLLDAAGFYFMKLGQDDKAGAILEDILPRLTNDLGPAHPQVLIGFYRLGLYYLNKKPNKVDQAVLIFRSLVNTAATHVLRAGLDPIEMCDGLAEGLKAKGTPESLEEALDLAQVTVTGFTNHKGQDHPRTQQAVQDLEAIQKLCEATKGQSATRDTNLKHETHTPTPPESLYRYDPLPKASAYRVLQYEVKDSVIHCSMRTVDEASKDVYAALSYTWSSAQPGDGLTADLKCKILCEGKELYITQNLFDALSTLRIQPNTFLWVDAICINQNDLEERGSQVAMMGSIYARARYTIVWLGKPDPYSYSRVVHGLLQKLAPTVNSIVSGEGADGIPSDPVASVFWSKIGRQPFTPLEQIALVQFFDRYWFERCWIMQEVVLAKGVFCVCGGAEFKWMSLCNFSLYLLRSGWVQRLSRIKATSTAMNTLEAAPPVGYMPMSLTGLALQCAQGLPVSSEETMVPAIQLRADEVKPVFYRVLEHLIHKSRTSHATALQDKVFAPAALALHLFSDVADPGLFTIDYRETVQETYTRASGLIMQNTQSLSLLTKVEDRSFRQIPGLPSWVPDFSVPFVQLLDLLTGNSFDCSAGLTTPCSPKVCDQTLEVQGIQIDTLGKTGPSRKEICIETRPSSWLEFLLHLDNRYVTGESSLEAFARTLIADQRENSTSGDELVETFYRYLLQLCAQSHELEQRITAAASSKSDGNDITWPVLEALEATAEKCRGIPTLKEVLQYRFDVSASKTKEAELLIYNSKRYFEDAHYRVLLGRRLFQSEKGYMGLCPSSTRRGDTIWIMPGCVVPVVLRKLSDSTQSKIFEFIGHCYVHGVMYGELFAPDGKKNLAREGDGKDDFQVQSVVLK